MTISIDEDVCTKYDIKFEEVLLALLVKTSSNIPELLNEMCKKEILTQGLLGDYVITRKWDDIISNILLSSEKARPQEDYLENLAVELMEIFPKGKKPGTCHYFRGNKKDTVLRLKKFFKLYGNSYTKEQIIDAAKEYVKSFNGDYSYMRILKYFIWKDQRKATSEGSYIEEVSDLANYIENANQEDLDNSWTSELR